MTAGSSRGLAGVPVPFSIWGLQWLLLACSPRAGLRGLHRANGDGHHLCCLFPQREESHQSHRKSAGGTCRQEGGRSLFVYIALHAHCRCLSVSEIPLLLPVFNSPGSFLHSICASSVILPSEFICSGLTSLFQKTKHVSLPNIN